MTSAEPQRMELERTVQLRTAIIGLAVNLDEANPELVVFFDERGPEAVNARTGAHKPSPEPRAWGLTYGPVRSLQIEDLTAQTDGKDILVLRDDSLVRRLTGHNTPVASLAVCPTAGLSLLVSGSEGGSVRIWNPHTGQLIRQSEPTQVTLLITFEGADGRPRLASSDRTGGLRIWNPQLPATLVTGPVSTRGFSDRVAHHDLLDRGALVQVLREMLYPREDDPPTVITVEGAWGSGKSTLLELVKDQLSTPATEGPKSWRLTVFGADRRLWRPRPPKKASKSAKTKLAARPLVVSFNPWRHQSSEQVWAGLAKAVTEAAEAAIMPHQNTSERYWFTRNAQRVDRRHLQRHLWKRTFSPLLSIAGLGFGVSVLNALINLKLGWAWGATVGLGGAGALHTAWRYLFSRASAFLPGELFSGPVVSNAFSGTTTDPLIRDPYYNARAGYLYLVQHDVKALLEDLNSHGYRPILLIDDLDRCTPSTTAQVFEAINVFLSDDFPATRFVLGLDTTVVASHVDHAYKELADARIVTHPDDPSPGWTFLRKLVQLPVRLPRTTADNIDRVLRSQLDPVRREGEIAPADAVPKMAFLKLSVSEIATLERLRKAIVAIEQHPEVREHLRRRLRAQPEQSVREEKRLLNVWQFYLRMLGTVDAEEAGHLVAVAEIATRWPAYLHRTRGAWRELADAVDDDVQWGATVARLGFAYSDRRPAASLRELLRDCDAPAVAELANRLF
ncbi:P-loop NTPase fold protein [Lentzea sp. NPDC092896]|uniref:P-loop NTPase fold protein n=1 Tax=Lentzea sp. NPDC092896 TaxID=3364127 RepID=UPI0038011372